MLPIYRMFNQNDCFLPDHKFTIMWAEPLTWVMEAFGYFYFQNSNQLLKYHMLHNMVSPCHTISVYRPIQSAISVIWISCLYGGDGLLGLILFFYPSLGLWAYLACGKYLLMGMGMGINKL